jgi:flavin-binding protein dodecin
MCGVVFGWMWWVGTHPTDWVKESKVDIENGSISAYKVNMQVTFELDN